MNLRLIRKLRACPDGPEPGYTLEGAMPAAPTALPAHLACYTFCVVGQAPVKAARLLVVAIKKKKRQPSFSCCPELGTSGVLQTGGQVN